MRFSLLGLSLALAWFILVNFAASIVVGAVAGMNARARGPWSGQRSAAAWMFLRVSPSFVAACFVFLVYLPAYARFEPREASEPLGAGLAALVAGALLVMGWTTWRGVAALRRACETQRRWMRTAEPVDFAGAPVPIYQIDVPNPVVCLVGIRRQRLFIARRVVEALSREELDVVVAHELAHVSASDNLRRLVLLVSPDMVSLTRLGSRIESAWASAAEDAADARATSGEPSKALALSNALLKVARMSLASRPQALPVSSLDDGRPIADRVYRLATWESRSAGTWLARTGLVGLAVIVPIVCAALPETALLSVHQITEFLVRLAS
jgi:beta-lactamase regulating signal transducer with metallopeptidase domain